MTAPTVPAADPTEAAVEAPQVAAEAPEAMPTVLEPAVIGESEAVEVLEDAEFRAEFSSRGGQLESLVLKRHNNEQRQPLEMVRRRVGGWPRPFGLVSAGGGPHPANEVLFVTERPDAGTIRFRYRGPAGEIEKTFHQAPTGFTVSIRSAGKTDWGFTVGQGLLNPTAEELKGQFSRRMASWMVGTSEDGVDHAELEPRAIPGLGLRWVALEDNYFVNAFLPDSPVGSIGIRPLLENPGVEGVRFELAPAKDQLDDAREDLNREQELLVFPQAESVSGRAYWGPKSYDTLASFGVGLEKTVRWGTFGFLARPLLIALRWIHEHVVANYGWSIVVMTLLISLLLLPLNHKSYVSMKKMQLLNPRMEAIKEKWRPKLKDKQGKPNLDAQRKMQEEVSALFRAEGVSPIGGCLPILLQMPVLFAFYSLLSSAVELRGAPWIGWIQDLSVADPYLVLPIVMGATQFLQQRLSPQVGDPIQRRMFQLMPIFFTVLFLGFPAGLVLYWLVSNLFGVTRQLVYNRMKAREAKASA